VVGLQSSSKKKRKQITLASVLIRVLFNKIHIYIYPSTTMLSLRRTTTTTTARWLRSYGCQRCASSFAIAIGSVDRTHDKKEDRLLIVGSGVAGSAAALIAAELHNIPVTLLFAGSAPTDCNSFWAQGGIIYRNYNESSKDGPDLLAEDIHRAGAGLCDDAAVRKVATEGPDRVRQLLLNAERFANVPFDRKANGDLSLCLEASHAAPRILHKADHTGRIITQHITAAAANHPNIHLQAGTVVTDLIVKHGMCVGVHTVDRQTGKLGWEYATHGVVLASGGLAGIYEHSTNPAGFNALGSSVALATRAGVQTQDLEYVQFHPTALCIPGQARFLLTEALRGEGAVLRDASGRAFAKEYHPAGELAPRDIVARAVFAESQKNRNGHGVYLDITHRDRDWLYQRFPSICEHLACVSTLDIARDPLPITPAAHYTCGGIATDLHGCTNIPGVYAAGEAARTGLHGGNRLASTSLLEGLVFGASVADFCGSSEGQSRAHEASRILSHHRQNASIPRAVEPSAIANVGHRAFKLLRELRRTMWDSVGVVRTPSSLDHAVVTLADLSQQAEWLHRTAPTLETAAVRDATCAGHAVALAAKANKTSAGAHCLVADEAMTDSDDEQDLAMAR
jgi:L-aspartate oxidase